MNSNSNSNSTAAEEMTGEGGGDGRTNHMIKINISYGPNHHHLLVPSHSTFGYVKEVIEQITGLDRRRLKVVFRGEERDDTDLLHHVGVKDKSKILVLVSDDDDHPVELQEQSTVVELNSDQDMSNAFLAISQVRQDVDKLADRVAALEVAVNGGNKVADEEFIVSTELLMRQLLKLDSIQAGGEARLQRKAEVKRVQNYHEILDNLKAKNSNSFINNPSPVAVTTTWETFDSNVESSDRAPASPPPSPPSSGSPTRITSKWEKFD